ncbi:MAG: hypothetical protein ACTS8H_03955 [Arsenophonus sp. NC-PE1-MAG3]
MHNFTIAKPLWSAGIAPPVGKTGAQHHLVAGMALSSGSTIVPIAYWLIITD